MRLNKIYLLLFFSFAVSYSFGQDKISIRVNIDSSQIFIGERIQLRLHAHFPPNEPIRFFTIDTIPHFEIIEKKGVDTVEEDGIDLSQTIILTSFDSGHWVIPSFELGGDKQIVSDTIPVDVGFSPFDPNKEYHDIKDVIDVEVKKKKNEDWYWYAAISLVIVAAMLYLLTKKSKKKSVKAAAPLDSYKLALQELEKLQKEKLSSRDYYSRLADIYRSYLAGRKGIASLQKTTDDLVIQMRSLALGDKEFTDIAQTLRMIDFVKFAKYEPAETERAEAFQKVRKTIELIEADTSAAENAARQRKS